MVTIDDKWCVATCFIILLFILLLLLLLLLLIWNNLGHSIQILGWSYIMTCGPMWVWHVDQCEYAINNLIKILLLGW